MYGKHEFVPLGGRALTDRWRGCKHVSSIKLPGFAVSGLFCLLRRQAKLCEAVFVAAASGSIPVMCAARLSAFKQSINDGMV